MVRWNKVFLLLIDLLLLFLLLLLALPVAALPLSYGAENSFVTSGESVSVTPATGIGTVSFTSDQGNITGLAAVAESTLPAAGRPAGVSFPYGLFSFNITNMPPGGTALVTVTFPSPMLTDSQYWKCQNGNWINCTSLLGHNNGDTILTLTLTDGGLGDADGIANGTVVDPGGPAIPNTRTQAIPNTGASSFCGSLTQPTTNIGASSFCGSPTQPTANIGAGGCCGSPTQQPLSYTLPEPPPPPPAPTPLTALFIDPATLSTLNVQTGETGGGGGGGGGGGARGKCLAKGTLIDTPNGQVPVEQLRKGVDVWTLDDSGNRVAAPVAETAVTPVPLSWQMIRVKLNDSRTVTASPGHPTADRRVFSDYQVGDTLDGGLVAGLEYVDYAFGMTYDLLPSSSGGLYWANQILLKSTLGSH